MVILSFTAVFISNLLFSSTAKYNEPSPYLIFSESSVLKFSSYTKSILENGSSILWEAWEKPCHPIVCSTPFSSSCKTLEVYVPEIASLFSLTVCNGSVYTLSYDPSSKST